MPEKPVMGWKNGSWKQKSITTTIYMPCSTEYITEEHQQIYREIFNKIDANKDGRLRTEELKQFLHSNNSDEYPKGICSLILKMADSNGDGKISFDEFAQLCECTPAGEIMTKNYLQRCTELMSVPIKAHFLPDYKLNQDNRMMQYKTIPLLIISISVIQIIFFINDQLHIDLTVNKLNATSATFSKLSTVMLFHNERKTELWRFVTYLFVQKDIAHISSNILMQILTGIPLELGNGCWRVLVVFLASVVSGSMSIAALSNCKTLVGASAGAYGLLGAHFSTIILNWSEIQYRALRLFILLIFIIVDIFLWIHNPITGFGNSTITHVTGFVIGFLIGVVFLRNVQVLSWEMRLRSVCLGIYIMILLIQMSLIVFVPDFDIHRL